MPLRLYPPLLAALMIALAAAIPGAFWWHARSARLHRPSRVFTTAALRPTPGAAGPTSAAPETPRAPTGAVRPFRAARIDSRTIRVPDADVSPARIPPAVSAPMLAPTPRRRHRHRRR